MAGVPMNALTYAKQYRQLLASMEKTQSLQYVNAYGRIYRNLQSPIQALMADIYLSENPAPWKVKQLERYTALGAQIRDEVNRFGAFVDTDLRRSLEDHIGYGMTHAEQLALAGLTGDARRAIASTWNRLPIQAVEQMMGFLAPGSPLHTSLTKQLGPAVSENVAAKLLEGVALGYNPAKTAALIRQQLGLGLSWAMRTARTSQLYAYREASRASYLANPLIVKGWVWLADLSPRTCISCILNHGKTFFVSEPLNDHHNGRCTMLPVTIPWSSIFPGVGSLPGSKLVDIENGSEWFKKQPEGTQRQILGSGIYEAWKTQNVSLVWAESSYTDAVYGKMRAPATLKDFLTHTLSAKSQAAKAPMTAKLEAKKAKLGVSTSTSTSTSIPTTRPRIERFENAERFELPSDFEVAKRVARDRWEEQLDILKDDENRDAFSCVREYTGSGYRSINSALRHGIESSLPTKHRITMGGLDDAFELFVNDSDFIVERGISFDSEYKFKSFIESLTPGNVFTDKAYVSTSMKSSVVRSFGGSTHGVSFEILVPKGAHFVPIDGESLHPGEFEVILPRGSKFRVVGNVREESWLKYFLELIVGDE